MRYIVTLFISVILISCSSNSNKSTNEQYYDLSIHELISKEITAIASKTNMFQKIVLSTNSKIETQKIAPNSVINDLKTFNEFDINKPAWQKSYSKINTSNYTLYKSIESRLQLKFIKVYGDILNPEKIVIYFLNQNNLYESSKLIEIIPSKSYSIFSVQDVIGMNPDTLFVKTLLY